MCERTPCVHIWLLYHKIRLYAIMETLYTIEKNQKRDYIMKEIIITNSEKETEAAGERLGRRIPDGTVIAMYGDLGAGKTAFVRGLARGMGIDARVSSPTFTIVNEYLGARTLIHFDMYRLTSAEELFDIGWEDYIARGAVCAVEWSENVEDAFFGDEMRLTIKKQSATQREIIIEETDKC